MADIRLYRGWINCPSTLQPLHKYHGTKGIVEDAGPEFDYVYLWLIAGDVITIRCNRMSISKGWLPE